MGVNNLSMVCVVINHVVLLEKLHVVITDQSLKNCLITMIGDADHLIRMRVADTMPTLYRASEGLMSCDQQEAIYQQITDTLQDISTLNVSTSFCCVPCTVLIVIH